MDTVNKKQTVLITGGRTLLGRRLTEYLRGRGYRILWLTRDVSGAMDMCDESFYWDVEQGTIAEHPLREADIIIHLAGASLTAERWSQSRKREILRSRLRSARVLTNALARTPDHHVHTIIYGSSLSIYDSKLPGAELHEGDPLGETFIARTFEALEDEARLTQERLGIRTLCMRAGMILDPYAGALPQLIAPVRFGLNVPIGKGEQYVNWIHHQDICRIYEHAIHHEELTGAVNACAPAPVTNSQFMYALSAFYGRDHLRVPLSSFLLRTVMGEMSERLIYSRPASVDKLVATGFKFNYLTVDQALRACLAK